MLTYPSDPLPQIVCPMDEDAIPPTCFCSAPPHSEPPPPLLPLSSITPSCANDGISGHRRSGRIQGIRPHALQKKSCSDSGAAQKPSRQNPSRQNPSPTKIQSESGSMVQVSHSEQPRVESTHGHEKPNEAGSDFSLATELQNKPEDQEGTQKKPTAAENLEEQFDNTTHNPDVTKCDKDTCGGLAVGDTVENACAPKGWVIGPLFQSFKSKMASFTEIVMSPVKLFRANSPPPAMDHPDMFNECELQADEEHSEPSDMFHPEAQGENGNKDSEADHQRLGEAGGAHNAETVALRYSKRLSFDVELSTRSSEQADEYSITPKEKHSPDSVPLQHRPLPCTVSEDVSESVGSSVLFQPSVSVSASREPKIKISTAVDHNKGKLVVRLNPLPRRWTKDRSEAKKVTCLTSEVPMEESYPEVIDEQVSHMNPVKADSSAKLLSVSSSVCCAQRDTDEPDGDDDGRKIETCRLFCQNLRNNFSDRDGGNRSTLKDTLDTLELESSAAGPGRTKRALNLDGQSQDSVKRKRVTAGISTKDPTKPELLNGGSECAILRVLRPIRKEVVSTNTVVDREEKVKPAKKRPAVSTKAKKKGKEMNEAVLNTQTEGSSDAMVVCSLDKSSVASQIKQKGRSSKVKLIGSCTRLKTRTGLVKPDFNFDNGMHLETTLAITSAKQAEQEPLPDVFVRPVIKCRNINKKPLKRKSPNQVSSTLESDSALVSTSSAPSVQPSELTHTDFNTSPHVQKEESRNTELNQPSKRSRKGFRGAAKSSASGGTQETQQCVHNPNLSTKEKQSKEGKGSVSVDPVYFEMTPFESNHLLVPSPSQLHLDCVVQLSNDVQRAMDWQAQRSTDAGASTHSSISVSRLRSSARRVSIKPRRADNQRRKGRVLHSRTRKGEETNSVTMDDAELVAAGRSAGNSLSRRLLRSYSCPEIPSFHPHDAPWTSPLHSPHHSRIYSPHQPHTPLVQHAHKSLRRARRHTVCSVEVEREIAPLCLRKEVYPSRRSVPYDGVTHHLSPSLALSPSTSLSALASGFLSSPLAFLSKKADSRAAAASPSTSSHVSSPTSSSSMWRLPGFLQRSDCSSATLDSSSSGNPLECEIQRRQQSEEDDDGEDTSSSSQEFEDVGLREEKAFSDSEIKVVQKHEERGKVSSIRIRKTLPKPQNNLTPMGLPKPVRLKKKEFSLEEIYTNKNFSKPPESRLETIFEVPLNRRNGSESWFGQRRVKRFLEFLEVGESRKPKKPLVGFAKAGISSSRTRRGCFPKDEPPLSVQDVDSLLCAKLDQLNLWLMHDQKDS